MKQKGRYGIKLVFIGVVAAIVLGGGSAKADFIFGEATNLGPTVNSAATDITPSLTGDGLELYFMTERALEFGSIWITRRAATRDAWGQPEGIGLPDADTGLYWEPCISADALTLYLSSDQRPDERYGASDIYVATRITKSDAWSEPVNIGPVVNTSFSEACPWISDDGLTLYFSGDPWQNALPQRQRPGGYGMSDIWIATNKTPNIVEGRQLESVASPYCFALFIEYCSQLVVVGLVGTP